MDCAGLQLALLGALSTTEPVGSYQCCSDSRARVPAGLLCPGFGLAPCSRWDGGVAQVAGQEEVPANVTAPSCVSVGSTGSPLHL